MFRFFTVTCVVLKRFAKGSVEEGADRSRLKNRNEFADFEEFFLEPELLCAFPGSSRVTS